MNGDVISVIDPQPLAGTVATILRDNIAFIWLQGEIDIAMAGELGRIAAVLPQHVSRVTLDTSTMTFADLTLPAFVGLLREHRTVSLRDPARLVRDLFAAAGMDCRALPADETTAPGDSHASLPTRRHPVDVRTPAIARSTGSRWARV